jgi:hypothetical protein
MVATALRVIAGLACFGAGIAVLLGRWGWFWSLWSGAGALAEIAALLVGVGTLSACVGWLARQHGIVFIALSAVLTGLILWLPHHWRIEPLLPARWHGWTWEDTALWATGIGGYIAVFFALLRRRR